MPFVEIICLANSAKHGAHCLAGLRVDGGGWVRPVTGTDDGGLSDSQCRLLFGRQVQPLDILVVHLGRPAPQPHHPEDCGLAVGPLLPVRRAEPRDAAVLQAALVPGPALFGTTTDRFDYLELQRQPLTASLALVRPERVELRLQQYAERLQPRVRFELARQVYDLGLSDPTWRARAKHEHVGELTDVLLTVSVTEPFEGRCFKLVAAIVPVPEWWPAAAPA